ncbi:MULTISPECIES: hypothetical protein [Streptomyces]|uniref:hypothetical protein n=1 Tax=Streptomyces TaxID=1883 RepID=UPI00136FB387|nr:MULTISPECIES: hypothetical protein [Streptomyces]MYV95928.1 hypothetical protein [Streptomyces sp. SID1034]
MAAERLNSTDEMLSRAADVLGSTRIVQVLWQFREPVPLHALQAEWHRLNRGRLSRRAVASALPGARRSWIQAHNDEALDVTEVPLTDHTMTDWTDRQVSAPLPAGSGSLWRLAAAPYDGGSLVSLTVPHFCCDGLGIFGAIGSGRDPAERTTPSPAGDALDLAGQLAEAALATARWLPRTLASPAARARIGAALKSPTAGTTPPAAPRFFSSAIAEVDATQWQNRAEASGGTVNSLFVEIAANLVRTAVRGGTDIPVDIGIPMTLRRSEHDPRANALVVLPLTVPGGPASYTDLRPTRQATKKLLRSAGEHSSTLVPEALWHLLPGGLAHRLKNPGAQQTDVVASNFGQVPHTVAKFAERQAAGVALRTMNVPGVLPDKARLRASLCLVRNGDLMTVTATGMPDHFGDSASLRRLVDEELTAWGLPPHRWWGATTHRAKEA